MSQEPVIVFVCEHGAAKSILAAAYFNKLASENDLGLTAVARGTHPDAELSSHTITGLRGDGLILAESVPTKLTQAEAESAHRIVSFCPLPEEHTKKAPVEYWDDIPPVSEDYERFRDAIVRHLEELIDDL